MTDSMKQARIALTFEAGGDVQPVEPILRVLQAAQVRATFFLDGQWVESHPHLLEQIVGGDHELGNHGFRHPDWTALTDGEVLADLEATEALVRHLAGRGTKPWARPPYGAINGRVMSVLDQAGYIAIYRDAIDGGHWPGETNVASIRQRALQSATDGAVLVLHTNVAATAEALPSILDELLRTGMVPGTLSMLDRIPPPRMERHPDFAGVAVNPGYIRPKRAGRWQSLSLLEMGALEKRPTNQAELVAELGETGLALLTGDGLEAMAWQTAAEDRYVLVLAGELRCTYRESDGGDLGYLLARAGDLFLCPGGVSFQLGPLKEHGRRWIAALWR